MGTFGADTLRDLLETNWGLSGRVSKTVSAGVENVVRFFAHPQIPELHEWQKAVEVTKILDPQAQNNENQTVHPHFTEVQHNFTIKCRYRVMGKDETIYDTAEQDIEDMCIEVVRIFQTVYDPTTGTGVFFTARYSWRNEDKVDATKPELVRVLDITLSEIQSSSDEVYRGYGGVLTFDMSASTNMDSAPAGDYIYTEAEQVIIREGTSVIEALGKDTIDGARVPKLGAGTFRGVFRARLFAKKSDIGSTAEKLNQIYILQANGEHVQAVFLHAVDNKEGTPATLTTTSTMKIVEMEKISRDEQLVQFNVTGRLTKPTTRATA